MEQATSHFSTQFQSYHPSLTNVQDNSCHPSIHTPVRPHFLSTIHQNSSSSSAHSRSIQSSSSTHSRSIQSEPTKYEPILHASSSSSSLLDRDQDLFDENEMKLFSEVEIIDEHGNVIRQQKMTAKDVFKLKRGEKVLVHVNGFYQPIKASGGLCTRFMTLLLKEPNLCPPDVKNWEECKSSCAAIMLITEFRRRFSLPQGDSVDKVILKKFDEKLRTLKFRLKEKLFNLAAKRLNEVNNIGEDGEQEMRYTDDELLEALDLLEPPENFTVKQWETYKKNLRKPEAKILSQYGKKARAEKLHCHTLGAVSLARKRDEFKMKNGRDANAVEFFEDCYRTKAGSYVDKATNELMDHARQVVARKISEAGGSGLIDHEKQSEIESDTMIELLGPDKPGRARFHGVGVTKSQVTKFSTSLRRIRGDALTNENRLLLDKVDSQNKQIESQNLQIESQAKKIEYQSKQMEIMERKIDGVTGELKLFQSVFKEIYPGLCVTRQDASETQV